MRTLIIIALYLMTWSPSRGAPYGVKSEQTIEFGSFYASHQSNEKMFREANLFSRPNPNRQLQAKYPNEPRGLLEDMAPYLNLGEQRTHLREVVGDFFCPGIAESTEGTATLVSENGILLTSAHLFLDKAGNDREALSTCFWQRKGSTERLAVDVGTLRHLTRKIHDEYYRDLSSIRLKKPLQGVQPARMDISGEAIAVGATYLMISGTQSDVPGVKYTTRSISTGLYSAEFVSSSDLVVQSCTDMYRTHAYAFRGIWGDCSGVDGSSGSGIFVLRNGELFLIGIHKAGGRPSADGKPFTMDENAPGGRSYSYEVELSPEVIREILAQ